MLIFQRYLRWQPASLDKCLADYRAPQTVARPLLPAHSSRHLLHPLQFSRSLSCGHTTFAAGAREEAGAGAQGLERHNQGHGLSCTDLFTWGPLGPVAFSRFPVEFPLMMSSHSLSFILTCALRLLPAPHVRKHEEKREVGNTNNNTVCDRIWLKAPNHIIFSSKADSFKHIFRKCCLKKGYPTCEMGFLIINFEGKMRTCTSLWWLNTMTARLTTNVQLFVKERGRCLVSLVEFYTQQVLQTCLTTWQENH